MERRLDALPSIPLSVSRPQDAGGGDRRGADAERLALTDQALAALLLRVANTPLYGRSGTVTTVESAVRLLGAGVVRRMAGGLRDAVDPAAATGVDRPRFLEHFIASAAGCRALSRILGVGSPDEAHAAGLLHSLGQAVFDAADPAGYAEVVRRAAAEGRPVYDVETEVLGVDHGKVGRIVAERWNFPEVLRAAIAFHLRPGDALQVPDAARAVVEIVAAVDGILSQEGLATCCRNGKSAGSVAGRPLEAEHVTAVRDAAREELRQVAGLLGLADREGAGFAESVRAAVQRAVAEPSTTAVMVRPGLGEAAQALSAALRELRGLSTADEAWEVGLKAIRQGLGADRVLFYAFDAERGRLDLRHGMDDTGLISPAAAGMSDLPLATGGVIARAVRDEHCLLVDDMGVDAPFLRAVGVGSMAVAPVHVLERIHGIVTADNLFTRRDLGDHDSALLGLFAAELGLAVENLLLHKQAAKLRALAERDELTGVNNRRNLMSLFQKELDRARRYGSNLSVAMVDIDFFKSFNDTYGHQAGDDVLRIISQVLVSASREIDIIGRYGGEEFVALLPETGLAQATIYSERLRAKVEARGRDLKTRFKDTNSLTISVGVTETFPAEGDDIERIIARVDDALYKAKEQGRNRVVVADVSQK